jgi:cytochrome c oxidase subunit 2
MRYAIPSQEAHIALVALAVSMIALVACGGSPEETILSPAAETGRLATLTLGCSACHGVDGQGLQGLGPSWQGLYGTDVQLEDGRNVRVDRAYLERSILEPDADIVAGFTLPMPPYKPTDEELDSLLAYLMEIE